MSSRLSVRKTSLCLWLPPRGSLVAVRPFGDVLYTIRTRSVCRALRPALCQPSSRALLMGRDLSSLLGLCLHWPRIGLRHCQGSAFSNMSRRPALRAILFVSSSDCSPKSCATGIVSSLLCLLRRKLLCFRMAAKISSKDLRCTRGTTTLRRSRVTSEIRGKGVGGIYQSPGRKSGRPVWRPCQGFLQGDRHAHGAAAVPHASGRQMPRDVKGPTL